MVRFANVNIFFIYPQSLPPAVSALRLRATLLSCADVLGSYCAGASSPQANTTDSWLDQFWTEDQLYFDQAYLHSVNHVRVELPGFRVALGPRRSKRFATGRPFLLLDGSSVLSCLYWLSLPGRWRVDELVEFIVFPERNLHVALCLPPATRGAAPVSTFEEEHMDLRALHETYFRWTLSRSAPHQGLGAPKIDESVLPFVALSVSQVRPPFADADSFVTECRNELFTLVEARPRHIDEDLAASRKPRAIDETIRDLSSRRHVVRVLTAERYVMVRTGGGTNVPA